VKVTLADGMFIICKGGLEIARVEESKILDAWFGDEEPKVAELYADTLSDRTVRVTAVKDDRVEYVNEPSGRRNTMKCAAFIRRFVPDDL